MIFLFIPAGAQSHNSLPLFPRKGAGRAAPGWRMSNSAPEAAAYVLSWARVNVIVCFSLFLINFKIKSAMVLYSNHRTGKVNLTIENMSVNFIFIEFVNRFFHHCNHRYSILPEDIFFQPYSGKILLVPDQVYQDCI